MYYKKASFYHLNIDILRSLMIFENDRYDNL